MFRALNSTPINFKKIVFDKFLSPHISHDIAALNYIYLSASISLL